MTTAAIVLLINVFSSLLKKFIYPRFGKLGVQVSVFVFALLGAFYVTSLANIEGVKVVVEYAIALFCLAVALYEVILSKLPIFKVPSANPENQSTENVIG